MNLHGPFANDIGQVKNKTKRKKKERFNLHGPFANYIGQVKKKKKEKKEEVDVPELG